MLNVIVLISTVFLIIIALIIDEYENYKYKKNNDERKKNNSSKLIENSVQKMLYLLGSNINSDKKIEKINDIILSTFKSKYSSIVLFDGIDNVMKVSNVEKCYMDVIKNASKEPIFSSCVNKDTSKYLISKLSDIKSYKSALERGIKSVMFSPIYYEDVYLGFWLMEDDHAGAFDSFMEEDFKKFKYNLGLFIENVKMQSIIEIANITDKQTGYYNNLYLYSNMQKILFNNDTSSISIVELKNISEINEKYGRNIGNTLISKACNNIKNIVSKESILIRYSGLTFLIITPGSNSQTAQPIMDKVLQTLKNTSEYVEDEEVLIESNILIHTLQKQNNIEKEIQKMLKYMEKMKNPNSIRIM
jgi:diguanylate cyclase (GGDEF)-like protein